MLTLSHPTVNDHSISLLINATPSDTIILIEDIDTMFENRKQEEAAPKPKHNQLTFSGLLNALDGISAQVYFHFPNAICIYYSLSYIFVYFFTSQGGRILVMTTNHIEQLDDALIRFIPLSSFLFL